MGDNSLRRAADVRTESPHQDSSLRRPGKSVVAASSRPVQRAFYVDGIRVFTTRKSFDALNTVSILARYFLVSDEVKTHVT